jgi:hypothetical protein
MSRVVEVIALSKTRILFEFCFVKCIKWLARHKKEFLVQMLFLFREV